MIELENDRRIRELLERLIQISKKMHAYHAEHPEETASEVDVKANSILEQLDTELEQLLAQDTLIDESVDEILEQVRDDVRALVKQHHEERKDDVQILKHARSVRTSIEKDRKALDKDKRSEAAELRTPKLAADMLEALQEKDSMFEHDEELVSKIRASLRRILEEERGP